MVTRQALGRQFGWLWAAYSISSLGTWLAFDALPLIAILALHAGPTQVSLLAAAGLAVGAAVAVPLGPWMDLRRKRPVMIAMDLVRFLTLLTIPIAYGLGWLSFAQLLIVSVIASAADITFTAASGAYLKVLVRREDLLVANGRLESTRWMATLVGPPLGGAAIGVLGPVTTVVADAVSYLLSAAGVRRIGASELQPVRKELLPGPRTSDMLDGWRYILTHSTLRPLFFNAVLNNGLIMAATPLLAVLMLGHLGFAPWQYALAFAAPCIGGLAGSRLTSRLTARFGRHGVLMTTGVLRACWPLGLAFVGPGTAGLLLVIGLELGLISCCSVFNPILATYRLEQIPGDRLARTLSAWSVTSKASIAALTALWGIVAGLTSTRIAIGVAGLLLLLTPLLLPHRDRAAGEVVLPEFAPATGDGEVEPVAATAAAGS